MKTLRERERERETSACIRISCNLEKYVSVLKMILGDASRAHRLLHDKVGYSMHAFNRMTKCLKVDETFFPEFHSDQIWIRTVLLIEEREDPNITKSGPLSARHRNTFKWRFAGPTLNAGLLVLRITEDLAQYC